MPRRERGDQPQQIQYTPRSNPLTRDRILRPWNYDACPLCGGVKTKVSKRCGNCAYPRFPVVQPDNPEIRHIPLTHGQVAIVDTADYEWLMQWRWQAAWKKTTKSYIARRGSSSIHMARVIMNAPPNRDVDHENYNTLDNRRINLRLATDSESSINRRLDPRNKCGFRGIRCHNGHWTARIGLNRKNIYLGSFASAEDAARGYDRAAILYHGQFAVLNFPEDRSKYEDELRALRR